MEDWLLSKEGILRAHNPPFCVSKTPVFTFLKKRTWPRDPETIVKVVVGASSA